MYRPLAGRKKIFREHLCQITEDIGSSKKQDIVLLGDMNIVVRSRTDPDRKQHKFILLPNFTYQCMENVVFCYMNTNTKIT